MEFVYKFVEIPKNKGAKKMKKYSCETHIDHALDMLVAETGEFPIMEMLNDEDKLSTKCSYCKERATYIVSSK